MSSTASGCEAGSASCPNGALMWLGYLTYPEATLTAADKQLLNGSPFFTQQQVTTTLFACSDLSSFSPAMLR